MTSSDCREPASGCGGDPAEQEWRRLLTFGAAPDLAYGGWKPAEAEEKRRLGCRRCDRRRWRPVEGAATRGIFKELPPLQMALLHLPLLRELLLFCHRERSEATYLPFLLTWHATSPRQRVLGVPKDPHAPVNPRGLRIFTQRWTPATTPVLGAVAVVHGFTGESSWMVQLTAVHLAASGFAVAALDHQGHGFSEGLQGHIPDIGPVLDDCDAAFAAFRADHPPPLPCFLYGESLGGAIALLLHLRRKDLWRDGAVLNGAMCGVSPRFKPPWPLEHLLAAAAAVIPTWRVAYTRGNIPERSFKVEWKRALALASPRRTTAPPRAATALELLRVCRELQGRFEEVELPLLVVHGGDDTVCDPACVEELFRRAGSKDKTLRVYPGMWHQIIGEPEENVEKVFDEIIAWLKARSSASVSAGSATADAQEQQ